MSSVIALCCIPPNEFWDSADDSKAQNLLEAMGLHTGFENQLPLIICAAGSR